MPGVHYIVDHAKTVALDIKHVAIARLATLQEILTHRRAERMNMLIDRRMKWRRVRLLWVREIARDCEQSQRDGEESRFH